MSAAAPAHLVPAGVPMQRDLATALRRTPGRLKAYLFGAIALAGIMFLVGEGSLAGSRSAVKTIGRNTAPSIIAAQEISAAFSELDRDQANFLAGTLRHQTTALKVFEDSRVKVTTKLVDAANNITFGEAERVPINTMFDGLGRYLELGAEARYRHDTGDRIGAATTYTVATDLMHQRILPAAAALDRANQAYLDDEYRSYRSMTGVSEIMVAIAGIVLLLSLISAQIFLLRRTRRILNPALIGATLVGAAFTYYLLTTMIAAREDIRIAKADAFDSIHALWQARSTSNDASGDESRALLDPSRAPMYEQAFRTKSESLLSQPELPETVLTTVATRDVRVGYSGFFADALNNLTFDGERQAAARMVREYGTYHAIDAKIRGLEKAGKHDAAVELAIGTGADQASAAYERFDRALLDVIAIDRREFDAAVGRAEDDLRRAETVVPAAAIAVALLAFLGLRKRIREYAG